LPVSALGGVLLRVTEPALSDSPVSHMVMLNQNVARRLELYVMRSNGRGEHIVKTGLLGVLFPDWGSAPLLPASAATPEADLAPALTGRAAGARAAKAAMLRLGGLTGYRTR